MNDSGIFADDYYSVFQLERFGNVLPESTNEEIEKEDQKLIEVKEREIIERAY